MNRCDPPGEDLQLAVSAASQYGFPLRGIKGPNDPARRNLMRIVRKDHIANPFRGSLGEEIFELIGRPDELGATVMHSLAYVVIPPGSKSPVHYHKESEETYYVINGEARLRVDVHDCHVAPGDACLIVPR